MDEDDLLINGVWSVYQELLISDPPQLQEQQPVNNIDESTAKAAVPGMLLDKGLKSMKISKQNSNKRSRIRKSSTIDEDAGEGTSTSSFVIKKQLDHNAKERIRRMQLNASYLALRALLPELRRSKKRWSAPSVVDKVLKYIPELENEIQELESKKENHVQLAAENKNKNKMKIDDENTNSSRTVSVNQVNEGEVIVQICMSKEDEQNEGGLAFTNLLERVEEDYNEIYMIKSVSTVYVCESRTCYHLHMIQMNHNSNGADYIAHLRDKLLHWLR